MAFADPQTVLAGSLKRTGFGPDSGTFATADGTRKMEIRHSYGRRVRRAIKLTDTKTASDPLNPTTNKPYSMSVSFVVDGPQFGYTPAEAKVIADGLVAYLTAGTGAAVASLLGGES